MKTMMMTNRMSMRMCCYCCGNMQMMRNKQNESNQHKYIISKERKKYEKTSIPDSIVFRAAA